MLKDDQEHSVQLAQQEELQLEFQIDNSDRRMQRRRYRGECRQAAESCPCRALLGQKLK